MGTSNSKAELVGKIQHYATVVPKANAQTVKTSAEVGKAILTAGAVSAGLSIGKPFPRETRTGAAGTKTWQARYTLKLGGPEPSALLSYVGPVHFIEGGTKPHLIVPRASRARMGRHRPKKGPTGRQQELAGVLFGFLAGGGGAGQAVAGTLAIGNSPKGRDGGVIRGAVNHPGTSARPFWDVTAKKAIEATRRTAEATHNRALIAAFR